MLAGPRRAGGGSAEEVYRGVRAVGVVNDGLVYFLGTRGQCIWIIRIRPRIHGYMVSIDHIGPANRLVKLVWIGLPRQIISE